MYSPKVYSIFHNLEKNSCNISAEVDAFVGSILKWADELGSVVEKEFAAGKESALFRLPETPCERKTRNKKARNAVVSKQSVVNSTFLQNEITNLNETVSTRTRGAKRAGTFKNSQFNTTHNVNETCNEMKKETLVVEKNATDVSDATFVMPKASTRTKPVLKNKQPDIIIQEPETPKLQQNKTQVLNQSKESPEKQSPQENISKPNGSPSKRKSSRITRTPSLDSGEENATNKPPIIINETPNERLTRSKKSRTLSQSPTERQSSRKIRRTQSGSPVVRSSSVNVPRNSNKSPLLRSTSLRTTRYYSAERKSSKNNSRSNVSTNLDSKIGSPETLNFNGNRTVTVKKELTPIAASTFVMNDFQSDEERTPIAVERFFRFSKTSTPAVDVEKTPVANSINEYIEEGENGNVESEENVPESIKNPSVTVTVDNVTEEEASEDVGLPKKKRKVKKDEEVKENIQEIGETVRITRTKSKAIRQMMEENESKQADLSAFAKKLINRAKMTSMKKSQMAALLEYNTSTPTHGPGQLGNNLPFGNLGSSKSKYHLLWGSSKKLKTPLATLPNSLMKIAKSSEDRVKQKVRSRDSSAENTVRSVTKPSKDDALEKKMKLKSKKEKEEEAALKRQNVIKSKQEELKRKNELKHQMAMKQREKLEQEKYHNMIQSEKEKEERHKLILQERQMKLKEEVFKKKMMTQQKIAETVERRRMEEEARIAKLKEMEAEEQRLALEKQKEQEKQEKRAQERLAQKKAREEYEMQLKQELEAERLKAEKLLTAKKGLVSASKLQSANKRQKFGIIGEKREWDYKPRHENDYGLEDEHSEVDSEDEKSYDKSKPAVPWGKKVMHGNGPVVKILTLEMLCEFMPCYQKSPDIYKMFKMTPSKRIKRTSSAIWNTPSS